jgi:hypothetical protein
VSSIIPGNVERYGCKATKVVVDCITSKTLFEKIGYDFDFISFEIIK